MQKVTRRTALIGTVAALATAGAAQSAPTTDPHMGWFLEGVEVFKECITVCAARGEAEDKVCERFGSHTRIQYGRLIGENEPLYFTSLEQAAELRANDIQLAARIMPNHDPIKINARWDGLVADFKRIQAEREAYEQETGFTELEAKQNELSAKEIALDFQIADTPATTVEGIYAQALVLDKWDDCGEPIRNSAEEPCLYSPEATALIGRILEGLARLSGNDPKARFYRHPKHAAGLISLT